MSSTEQMRKTPAYADLLALGDSAILDLIKALPHSASPMALMVLLTTITGENPVMDRDRGDVSAMITAWLSWGTDVLPTDEQVRKSHSPEFNKQMDERRAKARAARLRREKGQ